ncbi:DNA repair protein RecO [Aliikangiella maris]|uniref:DNA repair protein RecO n=2 Tax=Aliikangiella maris TaxID=3162458 RepID=A0ABV3MMW7_9GAMM
MSQKSYPITAYVLHSIPYQDNHQIFQLFSKQIGRLSVIAKGIRGPRSQARKANLRPFSELKLDIVGKSDLKTLTHCELTNPSSEFGICYDQKLLACAYYANEVLLRALPEHQEFEAVYSGYQTLLRALPTEQSQAHSLRQFEWCLLNELGIAPDFQLDVENNPIVNDCFYYLSPQAGFNKVSTQDKTGAFAGSSILAIHDDSIKHDSKETRQIMRLLLQDIIGNQPLQSRKLWRQIPLN